MKGQNATKNSPLLISNEEKKDVAASFQQAAFTDLVDKIGRAADTYGCKSLLVGGGVSQNRYLRALLEERASLPVFWPPQGLSLDNGAMIAGLGYHIFQQQGGSTELKCDPRLSIHDCTLPTPTSHALSS